MYIADLERFDGWLTHPDVPVVTVGWLGDAVLEPGDVPPEVIDAVEAGVRAFAYTDHEMGGHTCEICNAVEGHGEIAIDFQGTRYVAPSMIAHYVRDHRYCPPPSFLRAVTEGTWLDGGSGGYVRYPRAIHGLAQRLRRLFSRRR